MECQTPLHTQESICTQDRRATVKDLVLAIAGIGEKTVLRFFERVQECYPSFRQALLSVPPSPATRAISRQ